MLVNEANPSRKHSKLGFHLMYHVHSGISTSLWFLLLFEYFITPVIISLFNMGHQSSCFQKPLISVLTDSKGPSQGIRSESWKRAAIKSIIFHFPGPAPSGFTSRHILPVPTVFTSWVLPFFVDIKSLSSLSMPKNFSSVAFLRFDTPSST